MTSDDDRKIIEAAIDYDTAMQSAAQASDNIADLRVQVAMSRLENEKLRRLLSQVEASGERAYERVYELEKMLAASEKVCHLAYQTFSGIEDATIYIKHEQAKASASFARALEEWRLLRSTFSDQPEKGEKE